MLYMDLVFALILIVIYLLCTVKNKKEYMTVTPSDITLSFYDKIPPIQHNSEIIICKEKLKSKNYIQHTNKMIYINKANQDIYKNNYKYKNDLYKDDFRWKYIGIFIIEKFDDYSREWLRNNLRAGPYFYRIIYIYNDVENKHNKKLFPFIEYGCTVVIYGLKPYNRYVVDRTVILTPKDLVKKPIIKSNVSKPYLKFYIDKFKLIGVLKDNNKIIDSFELNTNFETILDTNQSTYPIKLDNFKLKWEGMPRLETFFIKWYDDVFDEWYDFILLKLKRKIDYKKIDLNKKKLPVNYMNYIYLLHRNRKKEITEDHVISQIIDDMNLPLKKIMK